MQIKKKTENNLKRKQLITLSMLIKKHDNVVKINGSIGNLNKCFIFYYE